MTNDIFCHTRKRCADTVFSVLFSLALSLCLVAQTGFAQGPPPPMPAPPAPPPPGPGGPGGAHSSPGAPIDALPRGAARLNHAGRSYYYWGGSYYTQGANGYSPVSPPVGARVRSLPYGATRVPHTTGGTIFEYNGVRYKRSGGAYTIVGPG